MTELAQLLAEDARARERALDPAHSFIVEAPAGAGKTELLTQRYLRLLAVVDEPEEILAVTFTNKAAGEMRQRVLDALALVQEPEEPHRKITFRLAREARARAEARDWRLAEHPARLRIQTLDSFNLGLVRQLPVLARFGSTPGIATDDAAEALYLAAACATLAALESGEADVADACAVLLTHLDGDAQAAARLLASLLARRDQWLPCLPVTARPDRAALEAALVRAVEERLDIARAALEALPEAKRADLVALAAAAGARVRAEQAGRELAALAGLQALPSSRADTLPVWRALTCLLLTGENAWRSPKGVNRTIGFPPGTPDKERMQELLAALEPNETLRAALARVRELPEPRYEDGQWRTLGALVTLLPRAVAELRLAFAEAGLVDYVEIALRALEALGTDEAPTDLALALDYRLRHILVDEFQDISFAQYELLQRLTAGWQPDDGRTFFAVGDPMQSIYRFRKAEVGLFLRACEHGIGDLTLEPLRLRLNTRSEAELVAWFNTTFARLMPPHADLATGAVPYVKATPARPPAARGTACIHALPDATPEAEAAHVETLIRQERDADPQATIAVLVASRKHLAALVPRLRTAGMPFRAVELEPLAHRPVVQDLVTLARLLWHPADRIAWLAALRAPWCGLRLPDLYALAGDDTDTTIPDRLAAVLATPEAAPGLTADGRARLARVAPLLLAAIAAPRGSLRERVEGLWLALGGPAAVLEERDLDDARACLELLGRATYGAEVPDLAALEAQLAHLHAAPDPAADERLQLMTIHKAKGLEFDVVIVPGLGRKMRRDPPQLLQWIERPRTEGGEDVLFAPLRAAEQKNDPLYRFITALHAERAANERARLFYVAATRARRRLHLVSAVRTTQDADSGLAEPAQDTLLAAAWSALSAEFTDAAAHGALPQARLAALPPCKTDLIRLVADWRMPPLPAPVAPVPLAHPEAEPFEIEFSWVRETARHVGTVVHRLLRRIAEEGIERCDAARCARLFSAARLLLAREGVPPAELEAALERVREAVECTLADPQGRWLLAAHPEARSEWELDGIIDGLYVSARLDRSFVVDGVRWIVDFKTSRHEGGEPEEFLAREVERYRPQLERYARLVRRLSDAPIRLGLYYPLLGALRAWDFAG
ncbi:MAG TPA: UvrD-helicase domain-containing protein [Gammaproteobacteria bacterium]|nr:UvrD-helicase domain-containing protein [Gammaproteobacteria bacterium]